MMIPKAATVAILTELRAEKDNSFTTGSNFTTLYNVPKVCSVYCPYKLKIHIQIICIWRNIQNIFNIPHIPNRITRTAGGISIRLPIPRVELFKKSVYYVGSKLWNDLDETIRDIKDLGDFKKNINATYVDG